MSTALKPRDEQQIAQPDTPDMQFLALVERIALNPDVDPAKLSAILDMQERIMNKRNEAEFNEAFARLSGKLPRIVKRGEALNRGQLLYKFARWEDIDEQIRPLLHEEGFSLSFKTRPMEGASGIVVTGILERRGHSREAEIPLPIDTSGAKNGIQGMGSTFSYGKRYTATMLLNITVENEDHDGLGPPQGFITPAQKDELIGLMQQTNTDPGKFLDYMQVETLDELPASKFAQAAGMLRRKMQKGAS